MTHQLAIPQAAQSPYPLQPLPQQHRDSSLDDTGSPVTAGSDRAGSWRTRLGVGAALGLASAIAATLYFLKRRSNSTQAG